MTSAHTCSVLSQTFQRLTVGRHLKNIMDMYSFQAQAMAMEHALVVTLVMQCYLLMAAIHVYAARPMAGGQDIIETVPVRIHNFNSATACIQRVMVCIILLLGGDMRVNYMQLRFLPCYWHRLSLHSI